jgi:hypothetical protein
VRALTNSTGNGVATVFVSWWEGELDRERLDSNLNQTIDPSDLETAVTTGYAPVLALTRFPNANRFPLRSKALWRRNKKTARFLPGGFSLEA